MAYIELLELDDSAGAQLIAERLHERYKYFSTLTDTAPTGQLKAIYQKKLADLTALADRYALTIADENTGRPARPTNDVVSPAAVKASELQAMLVLHTEGRALKSFNLLPGINILGRAQSVVGNSVVIDDDYMSRAHAVIEITGLRDQSALLFDIGEMPGYKQSTNGVYLNGDSQRLSGKVAIRPNDTVQVGYAKLVLTYATADGQQQAVASVGNREHSKTVFIKVN